MKILGRVRQLAVKCAKDDSGMALMMVVAASMIVFIMLGASITMVEQRDKQTTAYTDNTKAEQLASAGIDEYIRRLEEVGFGYSKTNPTLVSPDGEWTVVATPQDDGLKLTASSPLPNGKIRYVEATILFPSFVDYCVFVIKDYSVGSGFTFDGKVYVQGWLDMATGSEVIGLAQSSAGFKKDGKTLALTNNRLAPGTKPYTGGARKLENQLNMNSVTSDLIAMAEAATENGINLPVYNAGKHGSIPSAQVTVHAESFANSAWPSGWTRSNSTYVRTTNASGRVRSSYAAEIWADSTSRRTVDFYREYDLSTYDQNATLTFWHQGVGFNENGDYAKVEYSVNGGSSWTQLQNLTKNAFGWTQRTFTLSNSAGKNKVRVRFSASVNRTQEYVNWDDITVSAKPAYTARQGYRLTFNNATVKVEAVVAEQQGDGTLTISNTAPLTQGLTVPIPANGIIFVNGFCWVQGTYSQKVTVAVPAPYDIIVPENLKYSSNSPKATCGLVAGGDIAFPHWYASMPNDLYVYAAMMSQTGFVNIDRPRGGTDTNYYPAYWQYASAYASNKKNSINLIGSRAMDNMGAGLAQGFVIRNSEPDPRLYDDPPPMYPNVQGEELKIIKWREWEE